MAMQLRRRGIQAEFTRACLGQPRRGRSKVLACNLTHDAPDNPAAADTSCV